MKREEWQKVCDAGTENLKNFSFTADAKDDLKRINDNVKMVRVTRLVKRSRMVICSALAVFAGLGIAVGGIFSKDSLLIVITSLLGMFCASVGVWWFISHIKSVTHKAICLIDNGKVTEFIFSAKGGFIYNTIEGEVIYERGKLLKNRHKWAAYEPSYPYVDFLDRDYSAFLKARTGESYDSGETYVGYPETEQIRAYYDDECKKQKFCLQLENGKPVKFHYKTDEVYVYSRLNEAEQTVFVPAALKGKISVPEHCNVEYADVKNNFKQLWDRL